MNVPDKLGASLQEAIAIGSWLGRDTELVNKNSLDTAVDEVFTNKDNIYPRNSIEGESHR